MVRCKMICTEKIERVSAYQVHSPKIAIVKLSAVSSDTNKTWAKYTPSGSIELSIDNPDAVDRFVLGQTYFVDFSEAPLLEADESKAQSA